MGLTLRIENETNLPDGGPLSVSVQGKRGLDIGRDTHLDWTLPDPTRHISSKHCEIRFKDGGYWLHDVSTNGTFLYGDSGRLKGPHRLRNGERLVIGPYIIAVAVEGDEAPQTPVYEQQHSNYEEIWNPVGDLAPPVSRSDVQAPREAPRPVQSGDFLDWASDVPDPSAGALPRIASHFDVELPRAAAPFGAPTSAPPPHAAAPRMAPPPAAPPPAAADLDWAAGAPKPAPVVAEPPPVPNPRRPVWVSSEPDGPWVAPGQTDPSAAPPPAAPPPAAPLAAAADLVFQPPMPQAAPMPAEIPAASMPAAMPPAAMPPPAAMTPQPPPQAPPGGRVDAEFVRRVARGAGIPEDFLARQSPEQLAEMLGFLMRLVVENVRQLLGARVEAKRMTRSANQTMIQALDNNPLKFAPTTEEALRIMFGPSTSSYLDARRALEQSFDDLKTHQIKTYTSMQQALQMLVTDFDPQTIEDETEVDRGIAAVVGSRKARLWDSYVARWQVKTRRNEGGLSDVFMQYFAECYERGKK